VTGPGADEGLPPSERGWVAVDYDRDVWIPCPREFPAGMTRESWSAEYARAWWDSVRGRASKREVAALAQSLAYIHQTAYATLPCHLGFIHLPNPRMTPLLVYYGVWQAMGERDRQLRLLTHADDPDGMGPPSVTPFRADKLGDGLKVMYYRRGENQSTVIGCLSYAWRSEPLETDLRLVTYSADLGRLEAAVADIDGLAQVTSIIQR
jgi:hypothetical protein